jgi:putative transposase
MKIASQGQEDPREERALARYAAVQCVIQALQAGQTLAAALEHACRQAWGGRDYSASTIEEWYYAHRKAGFGGLRSGPRRDRGQAWALDESQVAALLALRRDNPALTLQAIAEELERRGVLQKGGYSMSTLQRRVMQAGLDRRSLRLGVGPGAGPQKAFESPAPNLLWMADCMHGAPVRDAARGKTKPYLFALIDDCTRLCVHAQYYAAERLEFFLDSFRTAVEARGVPQKLYTDNGPAFKSQQLGLVCANLGVRLIHCRPYHSWSKGKVERFFRTVQMQFEAGLAFAPVDGLEELNRRFWKWLEEDYHQREHSAMAGESPAGRFARLGSGLRLLCGAEPLDRWFGMRVKRRVRKDATFSLGARFWEVPVYLRGQQIVVHFDPVGFSWVEIEHQGRNLGRVRPCDKRGNSQLGSSHDDYEEAF